jgi:hypothetical protein
MMIPASFTSGATLGLERIPGKFPIPDLRDVVRIVPGKGLPSVEFKIVHEYIGFFVILILEDDSKPVGEIASVDFDRYRFDDAYILDDAVAAFELGPQPILVVPSAYTRESRTAAG